MGNTPSKLIATVEVELQIIDKPKRLLIQNPLKLNWMIFSFYGVHFWNIFTFKVL